MNKSPEDFQIDQLLGRQFKINQHRTSNKCLKEFSTALDSRGVCLSSQKHWIAAWNRFENNSEQYIQRIPAIRINNRDPLKIIKHRTEYYLKTRP